MMPDNNIIGLIPKCMLLLIAYLTSLNSREIPVNSFCFCVPH